MRLLELEPLVIALQLLAVVNCVQPKNLTFMLITSFGQYGLNTSGAVPAADMALRDVNTRSGLLPGYTLMYDTIRNSQCQYEASLDTFFQGIQSPPVKLAIIGCGCSAATEPVAAISHHWNISQISYFSASTTLSNRKRYKRYFRTNPSFAIEPPALASLITHFGWKRIAFLTQNGNLFTTAAMSFQGVLNKMGYSTAIRLFEMSSENPALSIADFFLTKDDYRVFFVNSDSGPARKIICEAYKRGLTYPKYVWIMRDAFSNNWWTQAVDKKIVNCSDHELEVFLEKAISFYVYPLPENYSATTDAGITAQQFQNEYNSLSLQMNYDTSDGGGRIYDAVWILATALNQTMAMVLNNNTNGTGCQNTTGSLVHLEQFQYSNELMGCLIQYNLQKTTFSGVSGYVQFDCNGTRIPNYIYLKQYNLLGASEGNMTRETFAFISPNAGYNFSFLFGFSDKDVYPAGNPLDGSIINNTATYSLPVLVVYSAFSMCGVAISIVCLVFSVVFRNNSTVKLSSPTLNYMIVTGSLSMYTSIVFHVAPVDTEKTVWATCLLSECLFTIGYGLCYGAMLSKMWRIYYIFHNPATKKHFIRDWHMVLLTTIITGISVCLVTITTAVTSTSQNSFITKQKHLEDPIHITNIRQDNYILRCYGSSTDPAFYLRALVYVYFAVLQIIGIVLAFQTRKVKNSGLKDSTFVSIIVYISSLILLVLVVNAFVFGSYLNASGAINTFGVLTLTTVILLFTFIPKMIIIFKYSKGSESNANNTSFDISICSKVHPTAQLNFDSELQQKQSQLNMLKNEIAVLKEQLSKFQNASNI